MSQCPARYHLNPLAGDRHELLAATKRRGYWILPPGRCTVPATTTSTAAVAASCLFTIRRPPLLLPPPVAGCQSEAVVLSLRYCTSTARLATVRTVSAYYQYKRGAAARSYHSS